MKIALLSHTHCLIVMAAITSRGVAMNRLIDI